MWQMIAPKLEEVYHQLNTQQLAHTFPFDSQQCCAPLPRAFQWADGSAYVNHVELVRKARNAEMPKEFWTDPLMYQGGSDGFLGPTDPILVANEQDGIDFESEIAIITDDVAMGTPAQHASKHILLLMLANDVTLRNLIPQELGKGFGFFHSKPASSFSPVAVTPEELGPAWDGQRVHLPLRSYLNNTLFGHPNAGIDMTFSFPELLAHAAKTRALCAGTIIGSGTVSNVDRSVGSSCIAEQRMLEIITSGAATTPFMRFGDTIKIEMYSGQENIFGSIYQQVAQYEAL
jgi:fumarylacetoacetate (FAA) hydrolase